MGFLSMFGVPSGPSATELGQAQQETGLASSLLSNYQQQYGEQQDVLKQLGTQIHMIQTGQTGPGFGGAENAARISLIQNTGAAYARNQIQAERERGAGMLFGGMTGGALSRISGIQSQTDADIASRIGANTSNALIAENAENYQQGRANAAQTVSGLHALAGMYTPESYAGAASATGQAASNMAARNRELQDAHEAGIGNLIKQGVGLATGGIIGGLTGGGSMGGGFGGFMKAGLNSLSGVLGGGQLFAPPSAPAPDASAPGVDFSYS